MLTVTVIAIKEPGVAVDPPLERVMDGRLNRFAAEMQSNLQEQFQGEQDCEDLVIWISYTSRYAIRWKIVNDVPAAIEQVVMDYCAKHGYIIWKGSILQSIRKNS
ncbi:MAG: hypothetical protein EOO92_13820 [Pedobacter sp.]|nr:MAG: hypothetical protein EOO92_13820 [Pedobacter sp.]